MASRTENTSDWSKWPDIDEWQIDDSIPRGSYNYTDGIVEGSRFSASYETLMDLRRHRTSVEEPKDQKIREAVLDQAKSLVVGDRNDQYGEPYDDFKKVADALNAYGFSGPAGREIMPRDVPFFQILVKLSRITQSPNKMDSWIDLAGYAACGAEVAEVEAVKGMSHE